MYTYTYLTAQQRRREMRSPEVGLGRPGIRCTVSDRALNTMGGNPLRIWSKRNMRENFQKHAYLDADTK